MEDKKVEQFQEENFVAALRQLLPENLGGNPFIVMGINSEESVGDLGNLASKCLCKCGVSMNCGGGGGGSAK
jgi:hypothetical protein